MVTKAKEKAAKQLGVPGKILIPVQDLIPVEGLEREVSELKAEKDRAMEALARREKLDDFIVAMEQFRSLFYTASDLAGRIPEDLDTDKTKEGTSKITSWFKGLVDRFKTTT